MQRPIGRFARHDMMSPDPDASAAFYTGFGGAQQSVPPTDAVLVDPFAIWQNAKR